MYSMNRIYFLYADVIHTVNTYERKPGEFFMTYEDSQSTQSTPYIYILSIAFRMH